jgi:hypothetical protein
MAMKSLRMERERGTTSKEVPLQHGLDDERYLEQLRSYQPYFPMRLVSGKPVKPEPITEEQLVKMKLDVVDDELEKDEHGEDCPTHGVRLWDTTKGLVVEIEISYKLQKKKVRRWRELHGSNLRS